MFNQNMIIKTDQPIVKNPEQITQQIADFWDQISVAWRTVWGEHIHHGYYENGIEHSPKRAQEILIEKLSDLLQIHEGNKILDAGCGMGGSSLYLNEKYHAHVTGITLSSKQAMIASQEAQKRHCKDISFKVEDALSMASLQDNYFDIVWSLESCEQMFDKAMFIKQAFRVLKPGGKFLLATWCSDKNEYEGKLAKKYKKLCLAFDLPYMPTIDRYHELLAMYHFNVIAKLDWSPFVKKSWDIGISLVNAYSFITILRMAGWRGLRFKYQTKLMQEAFHQDRVRYGVFVATK